MAEIVPYPQEDLFDVLTQELYNPDGCLPEVDQYLTHFPAQSDFDFPLDWLEAAEGAEKVQGVENVCPASAPASRVTASDIAALGSKRGTSGQLEDPSDFPPCLLTMQVSELNEWLSRFVVEVRRT